MFQKNYVGLIFSSQIEEYVGAKGNTLVDHKKIKNIKGIKRHKKRKREKYQKGIKDIKT